MRVLPDFADVRDAAGRLAGLAVRTPLIESPALNERAGGRVLLKAETLQRSGSFKFRGAYNRISRLDEAEKRRGVVAVSSGNHAQGVAMAAGMVGTRALIFMPADAPRVKLDGVRALGGEVVLYDRLAEDREALAAAALAETGGAWVPPFDDRFIIAGQGTIGLEMVEQAAAAGAELDAVYCGAGGGGMIAGIGLALHALSPRTRIWAVEPEAYDDHLRSLQAGERLAFPAGASSICDALGSPRPGEITFALNQPRLAGVVTVTDEEVRAAMRYAFQVLKLVVEPGGAVGLAAVLAGKASCPGGAIGLVLSGGNVDSDLFAAAIAQP